MASFPNSMGHPSLSSVAFRSPFFILAVVSISCFCSAAYAASGNETDRQALLEFKAKIIHDPFMVFSSWNDSIHFCQWHGVTCGRRHKRITMLDLRSLKLVGSISPFIGNLSFLRFLLLANNSFIHQIPSEVGRLHRLEVLFLSNNSIGGRIPTNISSCSNLKHFRVRFNQLEGKIPAELASFSRLQMLYASRNKLSGTIPPLLGNLSSLEELHLTENFLSGSIPDALGQITNLRILAFFGNQFSGTIPPSIFNLSSITGMDLGSNQLEGTLPFDLGITLPNLQFFSIAKNHFNGSIPPSISNALNLNAVYILRNKFTGSVPSMGNLQRLTEFVAYKNELGSHAADDLSFICSLTNTTSLNWLSIGINKLGGQLPGCISNLSSNFTVLELYDNNIVGGIPSGIVNLLNLETLALFNNQLSGMIPHNIGELQKLQDLELSENNFSSNIPHSLGNLTLLSTLTLGQNNFQGKIPFSLANCQHLNVLSLSDNNLSGTLPPQVVGLSSLSIGFDLSNNRFTGPLPIEVGNLKNLVYLSLSKNMLSGEIPSSLGSCVMLEFLYMRGNFFQGVIPPSFGSLRGLYELDLSQNNFSGKIPKFFVGFKLLYHLNLSYNNFEGPVLTNGIFKNSSAIFVAGNSQLCGGILEMKLPKCNFTKPKKMKLTFTMKVIISIVCGLVGAISMLSILFVCWSKKKRKEPTSSSSRDMFLNLSYQSLFKATNGFSSNNLLGVGSFGTVYKGILDEGQTTIAVKVINLLQCGALRSFLAECEAFRNIRHRNLVRLFTVCSSVDYNGNDFKALVYEFMVNGSLEEWLHPIAKEDQAQQKQRNLNLFQRLNIAIDVANALEYLHLHCQTPIFHCDLKPNNILLDEEIIGHVGDFGLARFSSRVNHNSLTNQSSSFGIRGTIGYTAPEYGMGNEVSSHGDIYSYGILLLEMFTGKRPTNDLFQGTLNLHYFVKEALLQRLVDITDPTLFEEEEEEGRESVQDAHNSSSTTKNKIHECLISIFGIGVACSAEQPTERMNIVDVISQLNLIRNKLVRTSTHGSSRATRRA